MKDEEIEEEYYSNGSLTAAFEKEFQICGNYAAMTSMLCREAGIENINMVTDKHAWNAVKINGKYYYIDSTYIDQITTENA